MGNVREKLVSSWRTIVLVCVAVLVAAPTESLVAATGESAGASFAKGMALLRNGDFNGALRAIGTAARAQASPPQYSQYYMLVRRVLKTREAIAKETDPQKWWRLAMGLQGFYCDHGLYGEVVALGKQMHERRPSVGSGMVLADAHLCLGQDAEAERVLSGLDAKMMTPHAKVLLGIALARQKKTNRAKAVLKQIAAPPRSSPQFLFDLARLKVLCGDSQDGLVTLTTAFESTSPAALDALKNQAKTSGDLASLAGGKAFAKVLATKSKVVESSCSRGSGCGSCPSRQGCPSGSGQPAPQR